MTGNEDRSPQKAKTRATKKTSTKYKRTCGGLACGVSQQSKQSTPAKKKEKKMTHTAEIHTELTPREYYLLMAHPDRSPETDSESGKTISHIRTLQRFGITDIQPRRAVIKGGAVYYYCVAVVNLQRLANGGKRTVETYKNEGDFSNIEGNFHKRIRKLLPERAEINKWSVQRIDYGIDMRLMETVGEYVELLQRGDKAHSWDVHELSEAKRKRQKRGQGKRTSAHPEGSVLFDNKGYSVNIYDKYAERKHAQEQSGKEDLKELGEAEGILRIEIQAKKGKVRAIKSKSDVEGKPLWFFARYDVAAPLVMQSLKAIAGEADYVSMNVAEERIRNCGMRTHTKADMIEFLRLVNRCRSLWKAKERYRGKTSLRRVLEGLNALDINPVTIPRSFGKSEMLNLYHMAGVQFAEQRQETMEKGNCRTLSG